MNSAPQGSTTSVFQAMEAMIADHQSVIPVSAKNKKPAWWILPIKQDPITGDPEINHTTGKPKHTWLPFQDRLATEEERRTWSNDPLARVGGVCGAVSENTELLDFDHLENELIDRYDAWASRVREQAPGLLERLSIVRTPRGGHHVRYRCRDVTIPGNHVLAYRFRQHPSDPNQDEHRALIETRGEGGYGLVPPSDGYQPIHGDPAKLQNISARERDLLHTLAREFTEGQPRQRHEAKSSRRTQGESDDRGTRPGDIYNAQATVADVVALLQKHGATVTIHGNGSAEVTRPNKNPREGSSGSIDIIGGIPMLCQFSTSWSVFDVKRGYTPYQIYALLEHAGDFTAAAKALWREQHPPLSSDARQEEAKQAGNASSDATGAAGDSRETTHDQVDETGAALPLIITSGRELRDITTNALACLTPHGGDAAIYQRNGQLVRVRSDENDHALIEPLIVDSLCGVLARHADWKAVQPKTGELRPTPPPANVVRDVLTLGNYALPALVGIVDTPTMRPNGTVLCTPGYDAASRLIYIPAPGLHIPPIPNRPSDSQIADASSLVLDDLLTNFPFQGQADLAHAFGLCVVPFVREMIPGPTPLHLIDAPSPGTGKGLLVRAAMVAAFGNRLSTLPEAESDAEWRKRITALLQLGARCISIDNVTHDLSSGSLASALTESVWADRLLGSNAIGTFPVRAVWTCTANNPVLSMEIARRSVRTRLDTKTDTPWLNRTFKHKHLLGWAHQHRGELVAAILTLIRGWVCAGRPVGDSPVLGTFEEWSRVVGGVLHFAGIPGFLSNLSDLYAFVDSDTAAWHAYVELWWSYYADKPTVTSMLFNLAAQVPALDIGGGNERAQRSAFGRALSLHQDRIIIDRRIEKAGLLHGLQQWRLQPIPADNDTGGS
jgi:Bifunctional DNA primase/polymerase, N-terminal